MKKLMTASFLAFFCITTLGSLPGDWQAVACAQKKGEDKPKKKDQPGPPVVRDKKDKPPPPPPRKKSN